MDPAEDASHVGWARSALERVRPFTSGSAYLNFITEDESATEVRTAYRDRIFEKLRRIKSTYDPRNVMAGSLNIPPG